MTKLSWRKWTLLIAIGVIGLGTGLGLLWEMGDERSQAPILFLSYDGEPETEDSHSADNLDATLLVPDDHRPMMESRRIINFRLTCTQDTMLSISFTGSQFHTPSGWEPASEQHRFERWTLKAGIPREVCVERPETLGKWRAYVGYSRQLKGLELLKANLEEAWRHRSFTNWNGKSWGGGRWKGGYEIHSEVFPE